VGRRVGKRTVSLRELFRETSEDFRDGVPPVRWRDKLRLKDDITLRDPRVTREAMLSLRVGRLEVPSLFKFLSPKLG